MRVDSPKKTVAALLSGLILMALGTSRLEAMPLANRAVRIRISVNQTTAREGNDIVVSAWATNIKGNRPAAGIRLFTRVNGVRWGARYRTLASGVAHLLVPLPEVGKDEITVSDGPSTSRPVFVMVRPRHFKIITDPNHLVIMEYETWFGPGYAQWRTEEAIPILGRYSSLDPRVLLQQNLWFDKMGINAVELDWTNNLTSRFPNHTAQECITATDALLNVYSQMPQHPKFVFLVGPEHNLWLNRKTHYRGPWFRSEINYLYKHYVSNEKYRGWYLNYEGKPLLLLYLNGPRSARPPDINSKRFTIRFVSAWLQSTHEQRYGAWSWYDQVPTPTYHDGKVEALTITDGYPATRPPGNGLNSGLDYWLSINAGGKNYGETYRTQWKAAMKYQPHFLFISQWNEFGRPDQYDANLSNDMEPTIITRGARRPSGWGFFYLDMTRRMIRKYHRAITARRRSMSDGQG